MENKTGCIAIEFKDKRYAVYQNGVNITNQVGVSIAPNMTKDEKETADRLIDQYLEAIDATSLDSLDFLVFELPSNSPSHSAHLHIPL